MLLFKLHIFIILQFFETLSQHVDKNHYKAFYVDRFEPKNTGLNRRGSPWPYYEWQKKQHENDKRIHTEVLRENKVHQDENKKQYDESLHESQETRRMQDETKRESSVKQAEKGEPGKQRSSFEKKVKRKDYKEMVLTHKESNNFLTSGKKKHYF